MTNPKTYPEPFQTHDPSALGRQGGKDGDKEETEAEAETPDKKDVEPGSDADASDDALGV